MAPFGIDVQRHIDDLIPKGSIWHGNAIITREDECHCSRSLQGNRTDCIVAHLTTDGNIDKQVAVAQAETPMTSLVAWHNARVLKN
jgi:hypothetical protein